jgi:hypothetical protein
MNQHQKCSQVRCNNPPTPGKKTCETCLHRFREMYRERRQRNVCVQIGCDQPPMPGLVRCQCHLEQTRELAGRARRSARTEARLAGKPKPY